MLRVRRIRCPNTTWPRTIVKPASRPTRVHVPNPTRNLDSTFPAWAPRLAHTRDDNASAPGGRDRARLDGGRSAKSGRVPTCHALRAKPHQVVYWGVLGIVQTVDGLEQYRVGPDTILLSIDVYEDLDGDLLAEYTLDLGKGDASGGTIPFSERGLEAERWRPAVEALELVSLLPLPAGAQNVGDEWTVRSRHSVPRLGLHIEETTGSPSSRSKARRSRSGTASRVAVARRSVSRILGAPPTSTSREGARGRARSYLTSQRVGCSRQSGSNGS